MIRTLFHPTHQMLVFWRRPRPLSITQPFPASINGSLLIGLAVLWVLMVGAKLGLLSLIDVLLYEQGVYQPTTEMEEEAPQVFFIAAVMILPVIEELLFRAPLLRAWSSLGLMVGLVAVGLSLWIWPLQGGVLGRLVPCIGLGVLGFSPLATSEPKGLSRWYQKGLPAWFYLMAIAFGLVHLGQYVWHTAEWWWLPVHMSPHILAGMVYGFVCLRYGLLASIAFHVSNNLLGLVMVHLGY